MVSILRNVRNSVGMISRTKLGGKGEGDIVCNGGWFVCNGGKAVWTCL